MIRALVGEDAPERLRELAREPGAVLAPTVDDLDPALTPRQVDGSPAFLELLDAFGMLHRADDPIEQLSRGTRQRVANALGLVGGGDPLLFDDPFAGLDLLGVRSFLQSLRETGARAVLVAHDPQLVAGAVDEVLDLDEPA